MASSRAAGSAAGTAGEVDVAGVAARGSAADGPVYAPLDRRTSLTAAPRRPGAAPPGAPAAAGPHSAAGHRPPQGRPHPPAEPDFGPYVRVFGPDTPSGQIQAAMDAAADAPVGEQAGDQAGHCPGAAARTFLFRPASYDLDLRLGCRTSVAGLGLRPDDVTIRGAGGTYDGCAYGDCRGSAENLTVVRPDGAPGGPGTTPEPDCTGVVGAPVQSPSLPPATSALPGPADTARPGALGRARPFLYVDERGGYRVFLPGLRQGATPSTPCTSGTSCTPLAPGTSVPLDRFFVAGPGESVRTVNKALSQGRHLLLTPGVHELAGTIRVKWSGTVVMALGRATLRPRDGVPAMTVADPRGVRIAGLLFEAGPVGPGTLLEIGTRPGVRDDPYDPASLHDVLFREGAAGEAAMPLVADGGQVLLDRVTVCGATACPQGPVVRP